MKRFLILSSILTSALAFTSPTRSNPSCNKLNQVSGDGSESSWAKALQEASGSAPNSSFDQQLKRKSFLKSDKPDPSLTNNNNLITWLEEQGNVYLKDESGWGFAPHPLGISTQTVDETTNESTGRGLLARRDINDGDELLTIPLKLCITKLSSRDLFGDKIIHSGLNEYLAIALQLIHEQYVKGESSFYRPYLDVLPTVEEVNPTFCWSDEDLFFLQGSPVIAATKSMQLKLQKEYEALLSNPETGLSTLFPSKFPSDIYTFENWKWAFCQLFSRAVRLRSTQDGETLAMVPYADLINHSPFSQAFLDARQIGSWLFKEDEEEVILYADRGYRKMEQIYISYGPKSNADLLLLYGFALERNPFNSVDVTVALARDNDPLADEKLEFLDKAGRTSMVDFPCYFDRYPIEMLEYLRLMQMTPQDLESSGKTLDSFDYTRTISAANEAAVLTCIITAVKTQLSKYPNTEEEDAILIQDRALFRTLNYKQRMAVRHRRNEKRLLKRTIAALEKQMNARGLNDVNVENVILEEVKEKTFKSSLEERLEKMGLPVDLR